jgi:hypothetical protein
LRVDSLVKTCFSESGKEYLPAKERKLKLNLANLLEAADVSISSGDGFSAEVNDMRALWRHNFPSIFLHKDALKPRKLVIIVDALDELDSVYSTMTTIIVIFPKYIYEP